MLTTVSGTLTPTPPFSFDLALKSIGDFAAAENEQTITDGVLAKAVCVNGQPVVLRVWSTGTVEQPQLSYTLLSENPLDDATRVLALERLAAFLSLYDDLKPFYALAEADPQFAPLARDLYGYHQVKFPSPFECACWAVLSQRNLMAVSCKMKAELVVRFGCQLTVDDVVYPAFPEPPVLAQAPVDDINTAVRNRWKAEGLKTVARAFDEMDEAWLRSAPTDEVYRWLRRIKGIGAWSAFFILLRGLGRTESVPPDEKRIITAAARFYSRSLDNAEVQCLAQAYGAYQGYWAHYLRSSL